MANYSPKPGSNRPSGSNSPYDPFSQLSSFSSSKPPSRSLTPGNPPRTSPPTNQSGPDAFSSLLGPSFSSSSNQENLSLAARRAAAQKEIEARAARDREVKQNDSAAWSGLDLLGHGLPNNTSGATHVPVKTTGGNWLLSAPESGPSKAAPSTPSNLIDDWGLSDFAGRAHGPVSTQSQQQRPQSNGTASLIDSLDNAEFIPDSFGESRPASANVEHNGEPDDDILGALGKPVEESQRNSPPRPVRSGLTSSV